MLPSSPAPDAGAPPAEGRRVRAAAVLLLALGLTSLIVWLGYLAIYQVDDAYIVYRYAENLGSGRGFAFNPGAPVEGVTCFLWTLLLAPLSALGAPLPVVAPLITALSGLLLLLLLPGVALRLNGGGEGGEALSPPRRRPGPWEIGAAVWLATQPSFAYWSVGALETVPYSLLLLLSLRDHLREKERGRGLRSAFWAGLATLMRPEAPLLLLPLALDRLLGAPRASLRLRFGRALRWGLVVLAFLAGLLLFRRLYFGDWLPNTYYAKTGGGLLHNLSAGGAYALRFFASLAPGAGAAGTGWTAFGGALFGGLLAFGLRRPRLRPVAGMLLALLLAVLLEGGDWMLLQRFFVPGLPLLALLGVAAGREMAPRAGRALRWVAALLGFVLVAGNLARGAVARDGPRGLAVNAEGYAHAHHQVAEILRSRANPGDEVALMDVGIIGYESKLRVFDISGLVEPSVAHAPGGFLNKRYPVERILARAPRFVVLVNGYPTDARIFAHPEFRRRYRLIARRNHRFNWRPPGRYVLHVFERTRGADDPSGSLPIRPR